MESDKTNLLLPKSGSKTPVTQCLICLGEEPSKLYLHGLTATVSSGSSAGQASLHRSPARASRGLHGCCPPEGPPNGGHGSGDGGSDLKKSMARSCMLKTRIPYDFEVTIPDNSWKSV